MKPAKKMKPILAWAIKLPNGALVRDGTGAPMLWGTKKDVSDGLRDKSERIAKVKITEV